MKDFMNQMYIVFGYNNNSGCARKTYRIINVRALQMITIFIF